MGAWPVPGQGQSAGGWGEAGREDEVGLVLLHGVSPGAVVSDVPPADGGAEMDGGEVLTLRHGNSEPESVHCHCGRWNP